MSFGSYYWGSSWTSFWGGHSHWNSWSWNYHCHDNDDDDDVVENTAPDAMDDVASGQAADGVILIDVLANDTDAQMDELTISAVSSVTDENGNDVGAAATIVGDQVQFDPTGLAAGDYTFTYTVEDGGTEIVETTRTIDFEGFSAGDKITDQLDGVTVKVWYGGSRDAMIFDAENPTGGDDDLGVAGQGNLLIISEDGDSSDPDDNWWGGKIQFKFDEATDVESITLVDVEEGAKIYAYDENGRFIDSVLVHRGEIGDGEVKVVDLGFEDVAKLKVKLYGSGAVDDIVITEEQEVATSDTATVTVTVEPADIQALVANDDTFLINLSDIPVYDYFAGGQQLGVVPVAGLDDNDPDGALFDTITVIDGSFTATQGGVVIDALDPALDLVPTDGLAALITPIIDPVSGLATGFATNAADLNPNAPGTFNNIPATVVSFQYFGTDEDTGATSNVATATFIFDDVI